MDKHDTSTMRRAKKFGITVGGGLLLIVGIIAIPYPGPGWLIVFAALGILAQEYPWAKKLLKFAKQKYDTWNEWVSKQNKGVKAATFIATALIVVLTLWLLNVYGVLADLVGLDITWLRSPII